MPTKREVVGLWPRFYATIRLLCHRLRGHIFVVLQEATTLKFFYCRIVSMRAASIASDDDADPIFMSYRDERTTIIHFFIVLRASKQWPRGIVKSELVHVVSQGQMTTTSFFYCHSREERWRGVFFTHCIARSNCGEHIFYVILQKAMMQ